jgi:hypothetical protein
MKKEAMSQKPKILEPKVQEPKMQEPKIQDPKIHEPKNQEMKLPDAKRPENPRANSLPIDGYVVAVDGKLKTRYENSNDAEAAGAKLKQSYPVIQVAIYDAANRVYTPVALPVQED